MKRVLIILIFINSIAKINCCGKYHPAMQPFIDSYYKKNKGFLIQPSYKKNEIESSTNHTKKVIKKR